MTDELDFRVREFPDEAPEWIGPFLGRALDSIEAFFRRARTRALEQERWSWTCSGDHPDGEVRLCVIGEDCPACGATS